MLVTKKNPRTLEELQRIYSLRQAYGTAGSSNNISAEIVKTTKNRKPLGVVKSLRCNLPCVCHQ